MSENEQNITETIVGALEEKKKQESQERTAQIVKHPRATMQMGATGFDMNLDGAIRFAQGLIDANMVPKGIKHAGAVVGLIEAGKELGLAPMYALSNLTFTNGRLGIMGDAAKALIRSKGGLEPGTDFTETYSGEPYTMRWTCTVTAHRRGASRPVSRSFSLADAVKAGLAKLQGQTVMSRGYQGSWNQDGPWATYTERMLMYRALGFLVRDEFSDYIGGAVLTEELRDYPQQDRPSAPSGPDPLLEGAPQAVIVRSGAIDAEVIKDNVTGGAPVSTPPRKRVDDGGSAAPARPAEPQKDPEREAKEFARAIEKLEGRIVDAESGETLRAIWSDAQTQLLLASLPDSERKRLTRLYNQNAKNFKN